MRPITLFALLALAGCGWINSSGDVAASHTGDLSNPPAPRADIDADFLARCGNGDLTAAGTATIRRAPYVQLVTDTSVRVLWTTTATGAASVRVSEPDGTVVATADAVRAFDWNGVHQREASLEGLSPATLYCYEVVEGGQAATGRTGFRSAPAAGSDAPIRFSVYGDNGVSGDDQDSVITQLLTVPADFLINTGDVGYDTGTLKQFEDGLFQPASPILRSIALFPETGNHDYETAGAEPFREVFALPENGGPDGKERWYSFDWGDAHFVGLDTEQYSPAQADWLEADLTANQRPWTIVFAHRPPFSSGMHGSDGDFRQLFVPILERHKVPIVFCGHDHSYERTKPIHGVTYVVTGGGGVGTRKVGSSDFTAFSEQVLHFLFVTIEGNRLTVHAIDASGREFDSLAIDR